MHFDVGTRQVPGWAFLLAGAGAIVFFILGLQNSVVFYATLPRDLNADVIVFYQPACPHCIAEIPTIQELVRMGYRVSAINVLKEPGIAAEFNVIATPTIYLPSKKRALVGEQSLDAILAELSGNAFSHEEGASCSAETQCLPT